MEKITKIQENEHAKAEKFVADIPDVTDWMHDYYFMVSLCEAVECMKYTLVEDKSPTESDLEITSDGRLLLTADAKDVLKAYCEEEHWQYFENYLLA